MTVKQINPTSSVFNVSHNIDFGDPRNFIGYVLYYKESPYRNETTYSYNSYNDRWKSSEANKQTTISIYDLRPYTWYAYYVSTYVVDNKKIGRSEIAYFRTNPSKPGVVRDIKATAKSSSEIIVNWSPPLNPNGNLTMYKIVLKMIHYNKYPDKDYCSEGKIIMFILFSMKY